jgi:hypothetical protein
MIIPMRPKVYSHPTTESYIRALVAHYNAQREIIRNFPIRTHSPNENSESFADAWYDRSKNDDL